MGWDGNGNGNGMGCLHPGRGVPCDAACSHLLPRAALYHGGTERLLAGCCCMPGESQTWRWLRAQNWIFSSLTHVSVSPHSSCCTDKPEPYQPRQLLRALHVLEQAPRQEGPLPCHSV